MDAAAYVTVTLETPFRYCELPLLWLSLGVCFLYMLFMQGIESFSLRSGGIGLCHF